jgi:hypothetical protein
MARYGYATPDLRIFVQNVVIVGNNKVFTVIRDNRIFGICNAPKWVANCQLPNRIAKEIGA